MFSKTDLSSSTGDGTLALRVKAVLVAFIPLIIFILRTLGIEIADTDIANIIEALSTLIASAMFLYGFIRQQILKKHKIGKYAE